MWGEGEFGARLGDEEWDRAIVDLQRGMAVMY